MRKREICLVGIAVLITMIAIQVRAADLGNSQLSFTYKMENFEGCVYTPQCFNCQLPIKISYTGTLAPASRSLAASDASNTFNKVKLTDDIAFSSLKFRYNTTYSVDVPDPPKCIITTNKTGNFTDCIPQFHKEQRWKYELKPISTETLQKGVDYYICIEGSRKATTEKLASDIIPSIFGFSMPDLAWWNSSWSSRKSIAITNPDSSNHVSEVNLTFWLNTSTITSCNNEIRIVDAATETEIATYELEDYAPNCLIKMRLNSATGDANKVVYYVYYGNPSATAPSRTSFSLLVDDFNDGVVNSLWPTCFGCTEEGGYMKFNSPSASNELITAYNSSWGFPYTLILVYNVSSATTGIGTMGTATSGMGNRVQFAGGWAGPTPKNYNLQASGFSTGIAYGTAPLKWDYAVVQGNSSTYYARIFNTTHQANGVRTHTYGDVTGGFNFNYYGGSDIGGNNAQWFDFFGLYSGIANIYQTPAHLTLGAEESDAGSAPTWYNNQTTGSTNYSPTNNNYHSVTWVDDRDANGYNSSFFASNYSGSWINYSTGRTGNSSTYTFVPGAVLYCWKFFANDSNNNWNSTNTWCKIISQAAGSVSLSNVPASPITYGTGETATCSYGSTDVGYTLKLYRNSSDITTTENGASTVLPAGSHNYVCNSTSTQNYTTASSPYSLTVTQQDSVGSLSITIDPGSTVTTPTSTTATGSGCPSQLTCSFFRDGASVSNPDVQTLPVGSYVYVYNTTGNSNYTAGSVNSTLVVNPPGLGTVTIYNPANNTAYSNINPINLVFKVVHPTNSTFEAQAFYDGLLIYNNTEYSNNTNVTVPTATSCGSHSFYVTANSTPSSIATSFVYFSLQCGLSLNGVFDELTLNSICYDAYLSNSTFSTNISSCSSYSLNNSQLPLGSTRITFTNASYISRDYWITTTPTSSLNVTGWLLQSGQGNYITTFVYSPSSTGGVVGALTSAEKFINGSWRIIEQKKTDAQGKGYFYLYPWSEHRILATYGSLLTLIDSYYPNPSFVLYINLGAAATSGNLTWIFNHVAVQLTPLDTSVANITQIRYLVSSSDSDLQSYSMQIRKLVGLNYTTLFFQEVSDSPSGGEIWLNLNVTNHTDADRFDITIKFKRSGYNEWNYTRAYFPYRSHSYLPTFINFLNTGTILTSEFARNLVAVFVAFFVAIGTIKKTGLGDYGWGGIMGGGSIIFVGVLAFFAPFGWFDWGTLLMLGLAGIGINLGRYLI